jgi:hypothetical protein
MLLFRAEEHVERSGVPRGAFMTTEQLWRLADAWYRDRNDSGWSRPPVEVAEALYREIGLTGDFWRLR